MAEKIFPASLDQLEQVQSFIAEQLEGHACSGKVKFQHAYKRHRLVSKDHKAKRIARGTAYASSANIEAPRKTIPYK